MKKGLVIGISVLIGLAIVAGTWAYVSMQPEGSAKTSGPKDGTVSRANLAKHDGLNGNDCWVAVDGTVYLIKGFALWEMGRHTPAGAEEAVCGRDLSQVILQSPHGKSKLQILPVIGKYQD